MFHEFLGHALYSRWIKTFLNELDLFQYVKNIQGLQMRKHINLSALFKLIYKCNIKPIKIPMRIVATRLYISLPLHAKMMNRFSSASFTAL